MSGSEQGGDFAEAMARLDARRDGAVAEDWAGLLGRVGFEALVEDTSCLVLVHDAEGVVRWMNRAAREAAGPAARSARVTLADLLSPEVAAERLPLIRRVLETGVPHCIEGMCWGTLRRTTYRPLGQGGLVLCVCRAVLNAGEAVSPGVEPRVAQAEDHGRLGGLTPREREVLALIGLGLSTQQIADQLKRSVKTVEWHRLSLGSKLGVTNRVELARIAIRAGLSPFDDPEPPCAVPESVPGS